MDRLKMYRVINLCLLLVVACFLCWAQVPSWLRWHGDGSRTPLVPRCANLLRNMSDGRWKLRRKTPELVALERELESAHRRFRESVGIPHRTWRDDGKCGWKNLYDERYARGYDGVDHRRAPAAFCDPDGATPCCDDVWNGTCVNVTSQQPCTCAGCVDTRMYRDALLCDWKVEDERCRWRNYTSQEACQVLNSLSTGTRSRTGVYFVGDSLMRNMFFGFEKLLTGDARYGALKRGLTSQERERCSGENLFMQRECYDKGALDLINIAHRGGVICDGGRSFEAKHLDLYGPYQADELVQAMRRLRGVENAYVLLGIGLHWHCQADDVISRVLKPTFEMLASSNATWPKIVWIHPLKNGLLKPQAFVPHNGDEAITKFALEIEQFLRLNVSRHVPIFDLRNFTEHVRSHDGTHFGGGVNIMKSQFLLNYLSTVIKDARFGRPAEPSAPHAGIVAGQP